MFDGKKIGIIGAGKMGEILLRGLLSAKLIKPDHVWASDSDENRRELVRKIYPKVHVVYDNRKLVKECDLLLLAVKPQNISRTLTELVECITEDDLLISIAAGVSTDTIADLFPEKQIRVIRVMPNAPASVLEGASALCAGRFATADDLRMAERIFHSVGKTVVIHSEELMDVVTGLSGSGPAFLFMIIEALSDAGVQQGLSREVASLLAAQTMLGSAKMFMETGKHPGELKDVVATPGGTTFAGLKALEKGNFRSTIMDAVEAATQRSRELGLKIK